PRTVTPRNRMRVGGTVSRTLGRIVSAGVAVILAVLIFSALTSDGTPDDVPTAKETPAPGPTVAETPTIAPVEDKPQTPGIPSRLIIPDLGVDAPVIGITAPNGVLNPPASPSVMGWWSEGAQPG